MKFDGNMAMFKIASEQANSGRFGVTSQRLTQVHIKW